MPIKCFLTIAALGTFPEIVIDKARFDSLKSSRKLLSEAFALEEKYECAVVAYADLETAAARISIDDVIGTTLTGYEELFNARVTMNIRLANLLSAARGYLDTLPQHAARCSADSAKAKTAVKKLTGEQYDASLEYRFMEQLRNHVQHAGMAIGLVTLGGSWVGEGGDKWREHSVQFHAMKGMLSENKKFKQLVLDELPDKIDLKIATRAYMDCLSVIHVSARSLIAAETAQAREHIQKAIDDYKTVHKEHFVGLAAIASDGSKWTEQVSMLLDWDDVRLLLEKRNRKLHLRHAVVTTKGTS
jgi:hypothetical protein